MADFLTCWHDASRALLAEGYQRRLKMLYSQEKRGI